MPSPHYAVWLRSLPSLPGHPGLPWPAVPWGMPIPCPTPAAPSNRSPDGPSSSSLAAWSNAWSAAWSSASSAQVQEDPLQCSEQPPQQLTISNVVGSYPATVKREPDLPPSPPPPLSPPPQAEKINLHFTRSKVKPESVLVDRSVDEEEEVDVEGEDEDEELPEAKVALCGGCGKVYPNFAELSVHRRKNRRKCSSCKWTTCSWEDLARHDREEHSLHRPHECPVCDARFNTAAAVHIHVGRIHIKGRGERVGRSGRAERAEPKQVPAVVVSERKPFVCKLCLASFCKKSTVREHIRNAHTLVHPLKCTVCVASFRSERSLKMHLRVHNAPKPFTCSVCGSRFEVREELLQHLQVHLKPGSGDEPVKGAKAVSIKKELGEAQLEPWLSRASLMAIETD